MNFITEFHLEASISVFYCLQEWRIWYFWEHISFIDVISVSMKCSPLGHTDVIQCCYCTLLLSGGSFIREATNLLKIVRVITHPVLL